METVAGPQGGAARSEGVYSIGAVARMLGVPAATLRAWEERYQEVVPARSDGGRRLFSRDQVDQLIFVRDQIETGLQPADAHRLLAQQRHEQASAGPLETRDSAAGGGQAAAGTVLLAERDPYAAELTDHLLRAEGYAVRIALAASSAAEILRTEPPSVMVVDLLISGGAGLDLCRAAHHLGSVPTLAVSAIDSRDQALSAGAGAFLSKPFEPSRFVSTVRDLAGTSAYPRRDAAR